MDPFDQQLANIEKIQAQCAKAGMEDFGWDDEARAAVLRGEMPKWPKRGRPLIEVPGAPTLSSYAEFENLKTQVIQARGRAQTSTEVVKEAERRMGQVVAKASELVELLLKLAAEADVLYRVVAPARLAAGRHAGTPILDSSGVPHESVTGPTAGMQAKAGIGPEDLVGIVLGSMDPFELVPVSRGSRHLAFAAGLGERHEPEPSEKVSDVLKEAAARQQARVLGITRQPRLVPGVLVPQPADDGSGDEPQAS